MIYSHNAEYHFRDYYPDEEKAMNPEERALLASLYQATRSLLYRIHGEPEQEGWPREIWEEHINACRRSLIAFEDEEVFDVPLKDRVEDLELRLGRCEGRVIERINAVLDRFTYWTDDGNNAEMLNDIVQILGRTSPTAR